MKNIMKTLTTLALLIVAVFGAIPAHAATTTYSTIISAAVNTTQTCFNVASTTNMQASGALSGPGGTPQEWDLWFDGEFTKINSVNTTANQVCVMRGKSPTRAGTHALGSIVFYGPAGKVPFILGSPDVNNPGPATQTGGQFGTCVSTNYAFLPLVDVTDGSVWNCITDSGSVQRWIVYAFRQWTTGHPVTNISDAAYTATLADEFINFVGLTAGRTVTLPAITGIVGKTMIIKNGTQNGSTITVASTASQGVGSPGNATNTTNASQGAVLRLFSYVTAAGGWSWATW